MADIQSFCPIYRINNRDENLDFFTKKLGMKTILEEGSLAYLAGAKKIARLVLEESPVSLGFRAVEGLKRHNMTSLIFSEEDFEQLLVRNKEAEVFSLENGSAAFYCQSPENDKFMISSQGAFDLAKVEEVKSQNAEDLSYVEDFQVSAVSFNVKNQEIGDRLLAAIQHAEFEDFEYPEFSFDVVEESEESKDLEAVDTWDIESFEYYVSKDFDLEALSKEFPEAEIFLDAPKRLLSVKETMGIELWFEK